MNKLLILSAQKRRLLSRVSTLEGTRDKAQNKIYELLQEIDDLKLEIEDELKQETQKPKYTWSEWNVVIPNLTK